GKTTIARILAKRVNCQNPDGNEPCNKCESCLSILNGSSLDVIEIDGASNRGIDPIRELRENVKFPPMVSHKKVYIIDEVHMLTTEAFNALLKTLEEPPAHVIFILATTELNKIPETILSRCQVFHFRKVALQIIQTYLRELLDKDDIPADDEALFWIARRGEGSVRDSLSFLEQAITYCNGKIQTDLVRELIGIIYQEQFKNITAALLNPDSSAADLLAPVQQAFEGGQDLGHFIWEYLVYLRNLNHILNQIRDPEFLALPIQEIQSMAHEFEHADLKKIEVIFHTVYNLMQRHHNLRLQNSYEQRILIELELGSLAHKLQQPSLSGVLSQIQALRDSLQQQGGSAAALPPISRPDTPQDTPPPSAGFEQIEHNRPDPVAPKTPGQNAGSSPASQPASAGLEAQSGPDSIAADTASGGDIAEAQYEIKKQFLGTVVDAGDVPKLENLNESV
ncbi:MAG: DNA polymerase III subunit gamma/tau, partial [Leptospiraceae bacterium]|nr:DNA polymerase III subunit gamma/tau [Leptospiraceae bacterium]